MGNVAREGNGAVLMGIAYLIRNGLQEGTVSKTKFELKVTNAEVLANMQVDDWAHIAQLVNDGYTSGEVLQEDGEGNTRRGWWDLSTQ